MKPRKQIPLDVIFDILANLPVKSLLRFRSISKSWSSITTDQNFAKIHSTRRSRIKPKYPLTPTIIISCSTASTELQYAQMFFSSELPEEGSESAFAVHLSTIPTRFSLYPTHSVHGLICMDFGLCATIFNPSTRQSTTLPFVCPPNSPAAASTSFCVNSFGFDPITQCYKVLNCWSVSGNATKYRVFTLGTTNNSWRLLPDGPSYESTRESVCIDGVIYFMSVTLHFFLHFKSTQRYSMRFSFLKVSREVIQ